MQLTVRAFASLADALGPSPSFTVPAPATVGALRRAIRDAVPAGLVPFLVAVNASYVSDEAPLRGSDDIALIPPVAGG